MCPNFVRSWYDKCAACTIIDAEFAIITIDIIKIILCLSFLFLG